MKKIISIFLLLSFFTCFTSELVEAKSVKVPANTIVPFVLSEIKTSKNTFEGEKIKVAIDKDVKVNDVLVFKQGARGHIYVSQTEPKRFWGQGGRIILNRGYFIDRNGQERRVDFSKIYQGDDTTWSVVIASVGIVLWPLLLFGFVKGKDAKTYQNVELEATVTDEFVFVEKL